MTEKKSNDKVKERLQRWEDKRRDQLSTANSLLLTFGIAICGYLFDSIIEGKIHLCCWSLRIGLASTFVSVLFGTGLTLSRLYDFRYTVKKIRAEKDEKITEMNSYKEKSDFYGDLSWVLFWIQISFLAVSTIALAIYLFKLSAY